MEDRTAVILQHMPLVETTAKKFFRRSHGEFLEDLIQVGAIGLIKAVDHFDSTRESEFNHYALSQIAGEIRHYLRDKGNLVKPPRWLRFLLYKIGQESEKLAQQLGRHPTTKEVAESLNIAEEGITEALKLQEFVSNPLMPAAEEEFESLRQKLKSQKLISFQLPVEDKITLYQAIEKLLSVEKKTIYLFFYYDLTQMEIGKKLGLSQRKVSRVIQKGLEKLKEILGKELW
ncbi:MAG: sigma-70 family RNA polymerase sigma factor [Candidatus Eremiobacteraeota bacterium]|nr:sigma-70 family RNA polymerase sigma factor [Candidatus Eremiobacteraeota bacterium]